MQEQFDFSDPRMWGLKRLAFEGACRMPLEDSVGAEFLYSVQTAFIGQLNDNIHAVEYAALISITQLINDAVTAAIPYHYEDVVTACVNLAGLNSTEAELPEQALCIIGDRVCDSMYDNWDNAQDDPSYDYGDDGSSFVPEYSGPLEALCEDEDTSWQDEAMQSNEETDGLLGFWSLPGYGNIGAKSHNVVISSRPVQINTISAGEPRRKGNNKHNKKGRNKR